MDEQGQSAMTTPIDAPPDPADPNEQFKAQLKAALDNLNHPGTLDLQARMSALHSVLNIIGQRILSLP
jgi:hypothetical protein